MNGYAVIVEGEPGSYSAYAPDLPGCVATGSDAEQVMRDMEKAIKLHVEALQSDR